MWISRRFATSSPVLSACRVRNRFYTVSARSSHWPKDAWYRQQL